MRTGRDGGTRRAGDGARRTRPVLAAVTSMALLAACEDGGLRVEPPAATSAAPSGQSTVTRSPKPFENIRNLDLRSQILADPAVPKALAATVRECTMCGLGDPVYADLTKDRTADVLVPIEGFNGRAGYVAYTVIDGAPDLVFAYEGPGAQVTIVGSDLELREQLYAPKDPACCATGPVRVRRYSWNGRQMILASTTGDKPGFAPYDHDAKVTT